VSRNSASGIVRQSTRLAFLAPQDRVFAARRIDGDPLRDIERTIGRRKLGLGSRPAPRPRTAHARTGASRCRSQVSPCRAAHAWRRQGHGMKTCSMVWPGSSASITASPASSQSRRKARRDRSVTAGAAHCSAAPSDRCAADVPARGRAEAQRRRASSRRARGRAPRAASAPRRFTTVAVDGASRIARITGRTPQEGSPTILSREEDRSPRLPPNRALPRILSFFRGQTLSNANFRESVTCFTHSRRYCLRPSVGRLYPDRTRLGG